MCLLWKRFILSQTIAQSQPKELSENYRTRLTISGRVFPHLMIRTTLYGRLGQTTPMTCDCSSSVELGICILPSPTSDHLLKSIILVFAKSSKSTCLIIFSVLYDICHCHHIASHNCLGLNDMPSDGPTGVRV